MKRRAYLALFLLLSLTTSLPAQERPNAASVPQQSDVGRQPPTTRDDDDVVRITTNLVQVDVAVTDEKGHQVTDLGPDDFEVREDGRLQKLTNFSYVTINPTSNKSTAGATTLPSGSKKVAIPPALLRPEQVKRTIALVVDDLCLAADDTYFVRKSLRAFVDKQMQEGDLVAIIRTSAGIGSLQQFTSDRRQLYAAIEHVKWNPSGHCGMSAFPQISSLDQMARQAQAPLNPTVSDGVTEDGKTTQISKRLDYPSLSEFNRGYGDLSTGGTLAALNYVVRGMRDMPGRKAAILFSDGMGVEDTSVIEGLRILTERATRASVVFYVLDARGLPTLYYTAADEPAQNRMLTGRAPTPQDSAQILSQRAGDYFRSQNGLSFLARETGGIFFHDMNDLGGSLRRVMEDQSGYYLLGYRPDESTFDPRTGARRYHKFEIKVKRRGLLVRTRKGFFGVSNEESKPAPATRSAQIFQALTSPFNAGGVTLRLTSVFGNNPPANSFMLSLLHVNARDLTFIDDADGWKRTVMDVIALTFNDTGRVIDELNLTQTIRVRRETFERIQKKGMAYALNVPIKKAGAYQLRIAIRDAATGRVGTAGQFIEVPKLENKRLALSGVVLSGAQPGSTATKTESPARSQQPDVSNASEGVVDLSNVDSGPAVRKFKRGDVLQFGYVIYNAKTNSVTKRPQLLTQLRLYREGQLIYAGAVTPLQLGNDSNLPDLTRIGTGGGVRLSTDMQPGDYYLQIVVTDSLSDPKHGTVTQWADFEIE